MQFGILGPTIVFVDGVELHPQRPRERALLAVLALAAPRVVTVDRLIADLWGDAELSDPANTLQLAVSRLRRAVPPLASRLVTDPAGYRLDIATEAVDVNRFE